VADRAAPERDTSPAEVGGCTVSVVKVTFVVEQAGCESCAARVRAALDPIAAVDSIEVDEAADAATVRAAGPLTEDRVNTALATASDGSGHVYRVRPGSWSPS
jgi:copper chaperone CopZ